METAYHTPKSLPTFEASPAFAWAPPSDDGLADAMDVKVLWDYQPISGDGDYTSPFVRVKNVRVVFHPRERFNSPDHSAVRLADAIDDMFDCGLNGRDYPTADWAKQTWEEFVEDGFATDHDADMARQQFARIRECAWARDRGFIPPHGRPWTLDETMQDEAHRVSETARAAEARNGEPLPLLTPEDLLERCGAREEQLHG